MCVVIVPPFRDAPPFLVSVVVIVVCLCWPFLNVLLLLCLFIVVLCVLLLLFVCCYRCALMCFDVSVVLFCFLC